MADDAGDDKPAQEKPLRITAITSLRQYEAVIAEETSVSCIAFTSPFCAHSAQMALPLMKELSAAPENEKVNFYLCDVSACQEPATKEGLCSLPAFFFYFGKICFESFSGNNAEKLRLMAKAAQLKKTELLQQREKQKEEEAKAAAAAAAAATAAAAAAAAAAAEQPATA